jgi:hypothetical protein
VNKLNKQAKVQPPQDNYRNMMKKLQKGRTTPKIDSQDQNKQIHHKKEEKNPMDEKIEYARNASLNARRLHIKNGVGYRTGDKHNSRVVTNGKEFINFTKANMLQDKKKAIKITNNASFSYKFNANASHVSRMAHHEFDASYVLMRNKFGMIIALHVGPNHKRSKTCVLVHKCLVANLRGPNQT